MQVNLYYYGPFIWVNASGEQTWWFSNADWQPGQWLRASFIGSHSTEAEGCHIYDSTVQILEEWTETKTIEDCGSLRPKQVTILHWVRFKVHAGGDLPFLLQPRFLVASY